MYASETEEVVITNGNSSFPASCGVWVDWNQNGDFTDEDAIVITGGPEVFIAFITAPANLTPGNARMRIVINNNTLAEPCGTEHSGETEDYTLNLRQPIHHEVEIIDYSTNHIAASYPQNFYPEITVYNVGNQIEPYTPVTFKFNNTIILNDTIFDTLYPDNIFHFEFTNFIPLNSCGIYPIKIYTTIPYVNDLDYDNDTVITNFTASKYLSVSTAGDISSKVSLVAGDGILFSNLAYTGDANTIGTFNAECADFGFDSGLILGTGFVSNAVGPNNNTAAGTVFGIPGDSLISSIAAAATFDAASLEFDITPMFDTLKLSYIFGSEEYPEFIGQNNDAVGIFVSGPNPDSGSYENRNIALVPGTLNTPVSVNTINYGFDNAGACMNCEFYVKNYGNTIQLDSYTSPLTASVPTVPGASYHVKIAIADASDGNRDSDVFLRSGSLTSPHGNVSLTGFIQYDNSAETRMHGVTVKLKHNDSIIAQMVSNQNGQYMFSDIPAGNYTLQAETTAAWGGVNAADGLMILKHFVGAVALSGLALKAADVNGDQTINSTDALIVVKRFAGLITEFPIHKNWVFENPAVSLTNSGLSIHYIKGLCYGDTNKSYIP